METKNGTNGNGKLEALRRREEGLKKQIEAERAKQQKAQVRDSKREFASVGEALVKYARENADFKLMLTQVLRTAITDDSTRNFLRAGRGWAI